MSERSATEQSGASWWSIAQRALGVGPILLYSGYHLWAQWPALYGREAWLARAQHHALGHTLGAVVLALFAAHVGIGLFRRSRAAATRALAGTQQQLPQQERGRHNFQRVTGFALVGFTLYHLTHVWPRPDPETATLASSYSRLWELLGQPPVLTIYVLGCGALAGHAAHAVCSLLEPKMPRSTHLWLRVLAGLGGMVLFALYLQVIGRYAAGEPMLPGLAVG